MSPDLILDSLIMITIKLTWIWSPLVVGYVTWFNTGLSYDNLSLATLSFWRYWQMLEVFLLGTRFNDDGAPGCYSCWSVLLPPSSSLTDSFLMRGKDHCFKSKIISYNWGWLDLPQLSNILINSIKFDCYNSENSSERMFSRGECLTLGLFQSLGLWCLHY